MSDSSPLAKSGLIKKEDANKARYRVPMGALQFALNDVPDGIASIPWLIAGTPKVASQALNYVAGTPTLDYAASKVSGYKYVDDFTTDMMNKIRGYTGIPEPEFGTPEYFEEMAGSFMVPGGAAVKSLKGGGVGSKIMAQLIDLGILPSTKTGKAVYGGLKMAGDYLGG